MVILIFSLFSIFLSQSWQSFLFALPRAQSQGNNLGFSGQDSLFICSTDLSLFITLAHSLSLFFSFFFNITFSCSYLPHSLSPFCFLSRCFKTIIALLSIEFLILFFFQFHLYFSHGNCIRKIDR